MLAEEQWTGCTVVCLASGPSLNPEDCETVRAWRDADARMRKVIAVNTTFRRAPWADVIYAMDRKWWMTYLPEIRTESAAERVTPIFNMPGVETIPIRNFGNSGAGAIALANRMGAEQIVLLGYDCKAGKRVHWHDDHPKGLSNAASMWKWPKQFAELALVFPRMKVVNCSRDTSLMSFPKRGLEETLRLVPLEA